MNSVVKIIKRRFRVSPRARLVREVLKSFQNSIDLGNLDSKVLNQLVINKGIDYIIDVGANIGQFGTEIFRNGFAGELVSYEPDPSLFRTLVETTGKHKNWRAFNFGVGSTLSELDLYVSKNDGLSSSFLRMNRIHETLFPNTDAASTIKVPIVTLDNHLIIKESKKTFLKIDTQGFESEVLEGARELLKKIQLIQIEVSVINLYDGQANLLNLLQTLQESGLSIVDVLGINRVNGKLVQFDLIGERP